MSQRETAPTIHGEVEYETVECVSCNERVAESHATDVIIGEITGVSEYSTIPNQYKFANGMNQAYVCEYCKEDPAKYPNGRVFDALGSLRALLTAMLFVVGVYLL